MNRPPPPTITACSGAVRRTFRPGRDIVVGRDIRADLRIPHPALSRAHVILRCLDGGWTAIDNDSLNGMFVDAQRVASVPVRDRTAIHLGILDGPRLTFELGPPPDEGPTVETERPALHKITIGRAAENDIDISDMMASRHHAVLLATPSGVQIRDLRNVNGTFVNGAPIKEKTLQENDLVTIGNVDFVFTGGDLVRRTEPAATTGGLEARNVGLTLEGGPTLLDRVSLTARPGVLTAVIGPAGSGTSTLLKVLAGVSRPTRGAVTFDGRDVHTEYESLHSRIGMVPQGDVVHRALTVAQALNVAATLRMPPDTTKQERREVISRVLQELEMAEHADTRVDALSGGQRKRVSVAMELLTEPSLLVLDEPTTGVDPVLDRQVMTMLRRLADAGRVIVVVTHSLNFLDVCDQVLLLAPGGKVAYRGPSDGVAEAMGSHDWADVYNDINADPVGAQRRFVEREGPAAEPVARPAAARPMRSVTKPTTFWRQVSAIALRQAALLVADRRYLAFVVLAPAIVGLLPLAVGGDAGLTKPAAGTSAPFEPRQIVVLLSFAAILMGLTLSVRDLVGERAIYRHEQAAGLSTSAYLLAKVIVFGSVAVFQSALLVLVVTAPGIGKRAPTTAAVLGDPMLELFVDVAATAASAAVLGLAISAVSRSSNQYIALLAVVSVAQLVSAGSFVPIRGRPVLEVIAALTPARWGIAATASSVDLANLVPGVRDPLWKHTASTWLFDMAMLATLTVLFALFVRWRLRAKAER
jgi:ABC-type multidrug transport system ATPase subunit